MYAQGMAPTEAPDMSVRYEAFPSPMDLSELSLEAALVRVFVQPEVTLTVGRQLSIFARRMLRRLGADGIEHPTAPYINLIVDDSLKYDEWFVTVDGKSVGSRGYP